MSHIATYKSTLGNVNIDLIKKALEALALEDNLELRNYVKDYYGKQLTSWEGMKIIGALFHDKLLPRGIGVAIDKDGRLTFVGDSFGSSAFKKIQSRIEQTYKLVALVTALQDMGYEISMLQETTELTTLEGNLAKEKITVEIDDKGKIITDFDGFLGRVCFDKAQKLAEELKKLGVNINVQDMQPKSESQLKAPETQRQRN